MYAIVTKGRKANIALQLPNCQNNSGSFQTVSQLFLSLLGAAERLPKNITYCSTTPGFAMYVFAY